MSTASARAPRSNPSASRAKAGPVPLAPTQLGYLGFGVTDLEAWELFAGDILGLEVLTPEEDGSLLLRMDDHHHRFTVEPDGRDDLLRMGWELRSSDELAALADRLEEAGTPVRRGDSDTARRRRVVELIQFEDPNGIACEAYCGALLHRERPFRSGRQQAGFVAGALGLGHVVLLVDSLEKSMAFYQEALGLRLSDWVWPPHAPAGSTSLRIAFLHCNSRHHSLALWQKPGDRRLHHVMLQVAQLDDVGMAYDRCHDRAVPIALGLGRHSNDQTFSFYMRSPSGFAVELGWGGREIDEASWRVQMHATGSVWGHRPLPRQAPTASTRREAHARSEP